MEGYIIKHYKLYFYGLNPVNGRDKWGEVLLHTRLFDTKEEAEKTVDELHKIIDPSIDMNVVKIEISEAK